MSNYCKVEFITAGDTIVGINGCELLDDIVSYVQGQSDTYKIMRKHESHSKFDDEMFDAQKEVADDILDYIHLAIRCQKAKSENRIASMTPSISTISTEERYGLFCDSFETVIKHPDGSEDRTVKTFEGISGVLSRYKEDRARYKKQTHYAKDGVERTEIKYIVRLLDNLIGELEEMTEGED